MHKSVVNRRRGAATLILVPITAVLVVLALGIAGFEIARVSLAREQLRACCDAAALTAAATISNAGELVSPQKIEAAHKQATNQGLEVFRRNYIASTQLASASLVNNIVAVHPRLGEIFLDIDFLDAKGKVVPDLKDPTGRRARAGAKTTIPLAFGRFLGLGPAEIFAVSQAGKQRPLDLVLTVDNSCSMGQEAYLKVVRRRADGEGINPPFPKKPLHHEHEVLYEGTAIPMLVKPVAPQGMIGNFSAGLRTRDPFGDTECLAGNIEPPGPITEQSKANNNYGTNDFTDVVADLQGAPFYGNTGVLVEASRGNLDNMQAYTQSLCAASRIPAKLVGVATKAEYERQVHDRTTVDRLGRTGVLQPFHSVLEALDTFGNDISAKEDCHFALIPFATIAGHSAGTAQKVTDKTRGPSFMAPLQSHTGEFDVPSIPLNQTQDNLSQVMSTLKEIELQWGTNTADALVQANEMINGNQSGRRGKAQPVVILLTDGLPAPTMPHVEQLNPGYASRFHGSFGQIEADARVQAKQIGQKGGRLYAIGFLHNMNPPQVQRGTQVLTGLVNECGRGSKFFLAQNISEVVDALSAIQNDLNQVILEDEVPYTGVVSQ